MYAWILPGLKRAGRTQRDRVRHADKMQVTGASGIPSRRTTRAFHSNSLFQAFKNIMSKNDDLALSSGRLSKFNPPIKV